MFLTIIDDYSLYAFGVEKTFVFKHIKVTYTNVRMSLWLNPNSSPLKLRKKPSASLITPYALGRTRVIYKLSELPVGKGFTMLKNSFLTTLPSQTSCLQTCKAKLDGKSPIVGFRPLDKRMTLNVKKSQCEFNSQTMKSYLISLPASTSNANVCKPFWNSLSKEWSTKLLSHIGIDSADLDLTSSNGFSKNITRNSWFSTAVTQVSKKNSLPISFQSFMSSLVESTENVSTPKKQYKKKTKKENMTFCKKIRLYPSAQDKKTILTWFSHARKTYNLCLESVRQKKFKPLEFEKLRWRFVFEEQRGKALRYLEDTPSKIRAGAVKDLCNAYKTNFSKLDTNPKHKFMVNFKSRKDEQSISIQKDAFVKEKSAKSERLFFPNSIKDKIEIQNSVTVEEILSLGRKSDCRLLLSKTGEITLCVPYTVDICEKQNSEDILVLDPGVRTAFTGFRPNSAEFIEYGAGDISKIAKLCKHKDKLTGVHDKEKSYQRRRRLKKALIRLSRRIINLKNDCHHRVIHDMLKNNDTIIIPEFQVSKMVRKTGRKIHKTTVKNMLNWSHYTWRMKLITKAKSLGKHVIVVTEEYTSKTCCKCGNIDYKLGSKKVYKCKNSDCNFIIDRDMNGAINILIKWLTENGFQFDQRHTSSEVRLSPLGACEGAFEQGAITL